MEVTEVEEGGTKRGNGTITALDTLVFKIMLGRAFI
jgi:hypothetical protein